MPLHAQNPLSAISTFSNRNGSYLAVLADARKPNHNSKMTDVGKFVETLAHFFAQVP
jgi:hypothetical protein